MKTVASSVFTRMPTLAAKFEKTVRALQDASKTDRRDPRSIALERLRPYYGEKLRNMVKKNILGGAMNSWNESG